MSGLEVAKQASGKCHVAFVTAYDKYAVAAFEQGAVDYVMKPFSAGATRHDGRAAEGKSRERAGQPRRPAEGAARGDAGRKGIPALDHRVAGQRPAADHRRGDLLLPGGQQVHAGRHRGAGVADPAADQGADRRARPAACSGRSTAATLVNVNAIAGVTRDIGGHLRVKLKERKETLARERAVHAPVQADVGSTVIPANAGTSVLARTTLGTRLRGDAIDRRREDDGAQAGDAKRADRMRGLLLPLGVAIGAGAQQEEPQSDREAGQGRSHRLATSRASKARAACRSRSSRARRSQTAACRRCRTCSTGSAPTSRSAGSTRRKGVGKHARSDSPPRRCAASAASARWY